MPPVLAAFKIVDVSSPCPVCRQPVTAERPPGVFYRGARLAFCGAACLLAFKRAPEAYAAGPAPAAPLPPEPAQRRSPFVVRAASRQVR